MAGKRFSTVDHFYAKAMELAEYFKLGGHYQVREIGGRSAGGGGGIVKLYGIWLRRDEKWAGWEDGRVFMDEDRRAIAAACHNMRNDERGDAEVREIGEDGLPVDDK